MKIFISHSSKDKWAARTISQKLNSINGVTTFLDEKDIKTGESINSSIQQNLKDCDDFLVLLSPASTKSEWVLIELGGAIALEKNIIPILIYAGVNEIPHILKLNLVRDINDVDTYYEEIKSKSLGIQPGNKVDKPIETKYKEGEKVKLPNKRPETVYMSFGQDLKELPVDWDEEMDRHLGEVTFVRMAFAGEFYLLDIDKELGEKSKIFAGSWLKKV